MPAPGYPAIVTVAPDGIVYTGSYTNDDASPSKVFAYSPDGQLVRDYTIAGQNVNGGPRSHGVSPLALDAGGLLYVADQSPPRILTLDPVSGRQRIYATLRDVPPCPPARQNGDCSDATLDLPASPDFGVFGPHGSLYVTDFQQALIWRIPPGGGRAQVWFTDPRLDGGPFGVAGIQFMPGGRSLMLSVFTHLGDPGAGDPSRGDLYTLPILPGGAPGSLAHLWQSQPDDAPDGFAIARSGDVYLALGGIETNQLVELSADGRELARVPATPAENAMMQTPFDGPSGVAFDGDRLIVSNLAYLSGNPQSWALFDVFAGEPGLPLYRPRIAARGPHGKPRIHLAVRPRSVTLHQPVRFRFHSWLNRAGKRVPVAQARIRFHGKRARTDAGGQATISTSFARSGRYRARARKPGLRVGAATVTACRRPSGRVKSRASREAVRITLEAAAAASKPLRRAPRCGR